MWYPVQTYYTQQWQGALGWLLVVIVGLALLSELFRSVKGALFE
jgi:hypothetical protein